MAIYDTDTQKALEESFLTYAGYTIQFRAIPDARDGLKYGARQLLYSQYKNKLLYPAPMKKAQASVGDAMKEFYVHGDSSCYGTYIRMAKPFALRYPLEETQGNSGTLIDPDNHSAARYVEMRGSELCSELFTTLNKDTITDWRDNYDQTTKFPMVLPTVGFYNIVNGVAGIATGISTSIPQFNIRDVNKALVTLLNNPNATFEELYCPVDFATGGIIINEEEVKASLKNGNGKSICIRAKIDYDEKNHQLIVSEMPYAVYTNTVCSQLQGLLETDPSCGIESFLDATGRKADIRIKLTKRANPSRVINWLYKNTSLQNHYSINMTMLDEGKTPKIFGWVSALQAHLNHVKIVKRKELEFDLNKAKARLHILEGYLIALASIMEVVEVIKKSSSGPDATNKLVVKFGLSEIQAKAVLELKLVRLVNMEAIKIEKEKQDCINEIGRLENILATPALFNFEIQKEIERVSKKFGDSRRTINTTIAMNDNDEPIEKKILMVYFSEKGAVQAQEADQYAVQMRGGKGAKIKLREGDFIKEAVYADNGSWVLVFTTYGKVHTFYLNTLEVGSETHIRSLLNLDTEEEVMAILPYSKAKNYEYVVISTKQGYLKKSALSEFITKSKGGIPAIKLRDDDSISSVAFVAKKQELFVTSTKGRCIRINESTVSATGRYTMGVQGITLDEEDTCLSVIPLDSLAKEICSITSTGYIKRTALSEFTKTGRATKGVILHKLTDGDILASVISLADEKEVMAVSSTNIIKISLDQVPQTGRNTQGVMAMKNSQKITKILVSNN